MFTQMTLWHWAVIALGGSIGAMGRFATVTWINRLHGSQFPWGTLTVNVIGSFIMGLAFVVFFIKYPQAPGTVRSFVTVGILGAFTTFSTFALESLQLLQENNVSLALVYMVLSVLVCLLAVTAGYVLGKSIL